MTTQEINNIMEQALSLKLIAQSYTEISSAKLKKIRTQVEKNRDYLNNLSAVYQTVNQVASSRNLLPNKKYKRTMSVLVTSNYHFYGSVNSNLIKYFLNSMHKSPTDQIVIGKTALEWLTNINYKLPYQAFILQEDYPTNTELNNLVVRIKDYEQIIIYYSELKTVMVQTPTSKDITQSPYLKTGTKGQQTPEELFIFEPEIEKILDFFMSQVTNLLLQQTFLESELSRTASRLISMDQAQTNADRYIADQKRLILQAKKSIVNSKLLQTYTAVLALRDERNF